MRLEEAALLNRPQELRTATNATGTVEGVPHRLRLSSSECDLIRQHRHRDPSRAARTGQWILWLYVVFVFGGMAAGVATIWWILWRCGGV